MTVTLQRAEGQLQQEQSAGERKEQDFKLAIQARDKAVKEAEKLVRQVELIEGKQKQQVCQLCSIFHTYTFLFGAVLLALYICSSIPGGKSSKKLTRKSGRQQEHCQYFGEYHGFSHPTPADC